MGAWTVYLAMAMASSSPTSIGTKLQEACVTVKTPNGQGSGTIITRKLEGKVFNFVLTAYHVIEDLRRTKEIIDHESNRKTFVYYMDAKVVQELIENGRGVGEISLDAQVICVDPQRDIALLRLRKAAYPNVSVKFYLEDKVPSPGTEVYHCASPLGEMASLTSGIISQVGRRIPQFGGPDAVFDQLDATGQAGSSGGMVALKSDGRIIGMVTVRIRGTENFQYMVPIRRIKKWAREAKLEWILDPSKKTPKIDELKNIPLELSKPSFSHVHAAEYSPPRPVPMPLKIYEHNN